MIKAIVFDVGGVLLDNAWPAMLEHYTTHLNVEQGRFVEVYEDIVNEWQSGSIREEVFWERMCRRLERNMPKSESLWLDGFKKAYKEKDDVFKLIKSLKEKGYKIGLLSNTEVPIMHFLIEKQYQHFDVFIYSCGIGLIKPDREIYEETAKQLTVLPEETIFIDDKEENVEGAKKIGMIGVQFKDAKQLENMLHTLLKQ